MRTAGRGAVASRSPAERRRQAGERVRPWTWLLLSLGAHGVLLAILQLRWSDAGPPPPRVMELELVQPGEGHEQGAEAPPREAPAPRRVARGDRSRPAPASPPSPAPPPPAPPAPGGSVPLGDAVPRRTAPTTSFRAWQQATAGFLPSREPIGHGGAPDGQDLANRWGTDRCEPPAGRRVDVLYLLFDASGSMDTNGRAQALSCAQQYARGALDRGARVVVGAFGRDVVFSEATRDPFTVEAALRGQVDNTETVLPARQLGQLLDRDPGATADLVIVSDGWFLTTPEILNWYRYYFDLNPDNRATMYTVQTPGAREAVEQLRRIGFEVYEYVQMHR